MAAARDRDDIARIAEETFNTLDNKNGVDDEQTKNQRWAILRALTECNGRVGGHDRARRGINRTTLLSRMKKLGIHPREFS